MARAANENWPKSQRVVAPHPRRGGSLWHGGQTDAQDRIASALRTMYADLLLQPLSPQLLNLVCRIEMRRGTS
jgi:hypothetical protein